MVSFDLFITRFQIFSAIVAILFWVVYYFDFVWPREKSKERKEH